MQTSDFLQLIFERCLELESPGYVTIFDKSRNQSHRFAVKGGLGEAGTFVSKIKGNGSVYFNVSTQAKKLATGKRGSKADCSYVPILWADLDLAGKPDAKKSYPLREHAEAALADMPLAPSLIVFSGRGLYPFWLLREPYRLDGTKASAEAFEQKYVKPWQSLLRTKLGRYGKYALDSTHDVTRMLRVVGSIHQDTGTIVDVVRIDKQPAFHDLSAFEPFVSDVTAHVERRAAGRQLSESLLPAEFGTVDYYPTAEPPAERFAALLANEPKFQKTWVRQRTDLSDESTSGYMMALCNHAVAAEWTDQEILNLVVAWRRKEKCVDEPAEIVRRVMLTIRRARADILPVKSFGELQNALAESPATLPPEEPYQPKEPPDTPELRQTASAAKPGLNGHARPTTQRDVVLEHLSGVLGVRVARWLKIGEENAQYVLVLDDGRELEIGGCAVWLDSPNRFRERIADACNVHSRLDRKQWPSIVDALMRIVEDVESTELSSISALTRAIRGYLRACEIYRADAIAAAMGNDYPFAKGDKVYFRLEQFRDWMGSRRAYRMDERNVVTAMHRLGMRAERVYAPRDENGYRLCRSYYSVERSVAFEDSPEKAGFD